MSAKFSKILGFKCISCGSEVEKAEYTCPKCSGNLDVVYDYRKIAEVFSKKDLAKNKDFSIWRYCPILPVTSLERIPSLQIGITSLCSVKRLNKELGIENLFFKDDTKLPSASFKDRASAVTVVVGLEKGKEIFTTASTGNAGCALACISANLGLRSIILVPKSAPKAKIAQLLLYGARVVAVNGTYDDAYDLSLKASERFGWYNRSTGYNPFTREGKKTASLEIAEQMSWEVPDYVFVPVGDGNIISGIWKGFTDLYKLEFIKKLPKLVAVQSDKSDSVTISYENAVRSSQFTACSKNARGSREKIKESTDIRIIPVNATTVADSISVDLPRDGVAAVKAIMESGGEAVRVSDDEILKTIKYLAEKTGIFAEPAGVTSFAGFLKMFKEKKVSSTSTVVCLITGNGLKDIDSALKVSGSPDIIDPQISELEKIIGQ